MNEFHAETARRFRGLRLGLEESFETLGRAMIEADGSTVRLDTNDANLIAANLNDAAGVARVLIQFFEQIAEDPAEEVAAE